MCKLGTLLKVLVHKVVGIQEYIEADCLEKILLLPGFCEAPCVLEFLHP